MKIFITFLSFLLVSTTYGQLVPVMLSLKGLGGNGTDQMLPSVTKTTDGGFVINLSSNSFSGTGNIDDFCIPTTGYRNIFVKYNGDASTIAWSKCFDYDADSAFGYLFPTPDGGDILGGLYNSIVGYGFLLASMTRLALCYGKKNIAEEKARY